MSRNILLVGFGDLGAKVASLLVASGHQVTGVRRTANLHHDIPMIQADVTQAESLSAISHLSPEVIIYCVAASGQSDAQYQAAYVDGLRNVLATQQHNKALRHVFFVSSTRVYGQKTDIILDENIHAIPADFGGARLLEAEQLLNAQPYATTVLRLSGIYGPGRLRMIKLAEQPSQWSAHNSWTNRIHRDDAARFIHFLVQVQAQQMPTQLSSDLLSNIPQHDGYIVTDSQSVSQYEVLQWIAQQNNIQYSSLTPEVTSGKRLSNQRMLATGFKLRYPSYQEGYQSLLNDIAQ